MKISSVLTIVIFVSLYSPLAQPQNSSSEPQSNNLLIIANSQLTLEISDPLLASKKDMLLDWIRYSAFAVENYYGQFPVKKYRLQLKTYEGSGIRSGHAFGGDDPYIIVNLGDHVTEQELNKDWVLVHEMIHLALAELPRRHHWLVEGLAVYIESVSRVKAGHLNQETVWKGFFRGMPNGLPKHGDEGLDYTPTWGRKYWGGAIFCLLADIEIRQRTNNRMGLQDAMRGVLKAGFSMNKGTTIETLLKLGDESTGQNVLMSMYQKMKAEPVSTDLPELWQSLGLSLVEGNIVYNNDAPNAAIRSKIFE